MSQTEEISCASTSKKKHRPSSDTSSSSASSNKECRCSIMKSEPGEPVPSQEEDYSHKSTGQRKTSKPSKKKPKTNSKSCSENPDSAETKSENAKENSSVTKDKVDGNDNYRLPSYLMSLVQPYEGDYFVTPCFEPRLVVQLMAEGFLPISTRCYLLPKLHLERSVIFPLKSQLHISKNIKKKKSAKFYLTVNNVFDDVVRGCHEQHGISWLYPPIVEAFKYIYSKTKHEFATTTMVPAKPTSSEKYQASDNHAENRINIQSEKTNIKKVGRGVEALIFNDDTCEPSGKISPVRMYSIEVWNSETNCLAAGELGYTVGNIYTSLTGFSREDSAGSVQLAALGALLINCGFEMWDLGMDMDYKSKLGARNMPRPTFVKEVHRIRATYPDTVITCQDENGDHRRRCKSIIADLYKGKCPHTLEASFEGNTSSKTLNGI